jgi:ketosteroid isomerase-like protein
MSNLEIEQIKRCEDERFAAVLAGDVDALAPLLHDDLRYVHSSGVTQDRAAYLAELSKGVWKYREVKRSNEKISIHSDVAIVTNQLDLSVVHLGNEQKVHSSALSIWVLLSNEWQLFAVQSTSLNSDDH